MTAAPARDPPRAVVEAEDLRFTYPRPARGRKPFGFFLPRLQVEEGHGTVLIGPSGSGKSTLLKLIAGILPMQEGRLWVLDTPLAGASQATRRRHRLEAVGVIFQDYPLIGSLSCIENVLLPLRLSSTRIFSRDLRHRAQELLERLELGALAAARPAELSQGEKQRVAIARALILSPPLLLADEPTTGLDGARARAVVDLLRELQRELQLTVLAVSHDPLLRESFHHIIETDVIFGEPSAVEQNCS